jgi:sulfur transfer complex TusBCD TusB component (DsrH family)
MRLRRKREEAMNNDELLLLLAGVFAKLDDEMLLHATRCAAHLYALRNSLTPRTVYDTLFQHEAQDEQWIEAMVKLASDSRGGA